MSNEFSVLIVHLLSNFVYLCNPVPIKIWKSTFTIEISLKAWSTKTLFFFFFSDMTYHLTRTPSLYIIILSFHLNIHPYIGSTLHSPDE